MKRNIFSMFTIKHCINKTQETKDSKYSLGISWDAPKDPQGPSERDKMIPQSSLAPPETLPSTPKDPSSARHMLSDALRCSQMLSYTLMCSQLLSSALRCSQILSQNLRCFRMLSYLSDVLRCSQMLSIHSAPSAKLQEGRRCAPQRGLQWNSKTK